jgi:hypothetical protein
MTFAQICEIGMKAREIARKVGCEFAALFLKAKGIAVDMAIAILVRKPLYA